jgi:hypothetical protein
MHRGLGEIVADRLQLAILGTEIVAPVADAVCLVDGERLHIRAAQQVAKVRHRQPFRRNEEQLDLAAHHRPFHAA